MGHDTDPLPFALLGIPFGLGLFYSGFTRLRLKRLIEALPTSKTRSLAMGTVELAGQARATSPLDDPIYAQPCVFYHVVVEEQRGSGKNRRWVTIHESDSSRRPFWLDDDTGRVLILPMGGDFHFKNDVNIRSGLAAALLDSRDEAAMRFMLGVGGSGASGLLSPNRRLAAQIIRPGDAMYVLGYACPMDDPLTVTEKILRRAALPLAELARLLKRDPARMRALDRDKDGVINAEEWDEGLRRFQQEAQSEPPLPRQPAGPCVCVRRSPDGLLILADESEKELAAQLVGSSLVRILGGPAIAIASAAYLASRLGLLF